MWRLRECRQPSDMLTAVAKQVVGTIECANVGTTMHIYYICNSVTARTDTRSKSAS